MKGRRLPSSRRAAIALLLGLGAGLSACESWMTWPEDRVGRPAGVRAAPPVPLVPPDPAPVPDPLPAESIRVPQPECVAALPPQEPLPAAGCALRWSCVAGLSEPQLSRFCAPPGGGESGPFPRPPAR